MADWGDAFSDASKDVKSAGGAVQNWWDAFEPEAEHKAKVLVNNVGRGVVGAAGLAADALPVAKLLFNPGSGATPANLEAVRNTNPVALLQGKGRVSQKIAKIYNDTAGVTPVQSRGDEYTAAIGQGVGMAALGGEGGILPALAGGVGGGIGSQAAHELFPKSDLAPIVGGIIGGGAGAAGPHFINPVEGRVTSGFGAREAPIAGASTYHQGIDIAVPSGTPVKAPEAGVISRIGADRKAGRWVEIDHGDGLKTKYLHLGEINGKVGDEVSPGDVFAKSGATGNVTGPHLHWAAFKDGKAIDPRTLTRDPARPPAPPMDPAELSSAMADPEAGIQAETGDNVVDFPHQGPSFAEDVLTPAERQDMDASVDKPVVDNTGYERFTPYPKEKTPANDTLSDLPEATVENGEKGYNAWLDKVIRSQGPTDKLSQIASRDDYHDFDPEEFARIKAAAESGNSSAESHLADVYGVSIKPREDVPEESLRDQNPPAASQTFGTTRPEGINQTPPVKSEEPHEPAPEDTPEEISPVDKLRQALDETAILRNKQERGYAQERAKRFQESSKVGQFTSGEEGYYAELSKLKGELPKQAYEGLRDELHQGEIDQLSDIIKNHPRFSFGDSLRARGALMKVINGEVPTRGELRLLGDVFDKDTLSSLRQGREESIGDKIANVLSIPRSLITLLDLAAPGRHALPLIGQSAYWTNIGRMFKAVGSEKAYQAMQNEIMSRPTYKLMKRSGVALTNLGDKLSEREEIFMSKLAERIPGLGKLYRAGGRGYTIYLNRVRADVFDKWTSIAKAAGADPHENPEVFKNIAGLVNNATGRGSFGKFNGASRLLNSAFFAPRLRLARLQMINPIYYGKLIKSGSLSGVEASKLAGGQAIKAMVSATGIVIMAIGLAKLAGYDTDTDPRSYGFGKIKWTDKTSTDVTGGYGTEIRTIAQLIAGSYVNDKGQEVSLTSGKFGARTRHDVALSYVENSAAPIPSMAISAMKGKDHTGRPLHMLPNDLGDRGMVADNLTMIPLQETMDAINQYGAKGLLALPPSLLGFSTRTTEPFKKSGSGHKKKDEFNFDFGAEKKGHKKSGDFGDAF